MRMPKYRTGKYAIWRACERFGVCPPDLSTLVWDDMSSMEQSDFLSYDQIRGAEEQDFLAAVFGGK